MDTELGDIWSKLLLTLIQTQPKEPFGHICQILRKMSTNSTSISEAVMHVRELQYDCDIVEQTYHIFRILMNSTNEMEFKQGLPSTVYRDFLYHLIDNEEVLMKDPLLKLMLHKFNESYLSFEDAKKSLSLYLSLKEYYQLANELYESVGGVMTKELAEKLLDRLLSSEMRPHLQLSNEVTKVEFVKSALNVFIKHNNNVFM